MDPSDPHLHQIFKVSIPSCAPLPYASINLGDLRVSALLDSGSARCLISERIYQRLKGSFCLKKEVETNMVCYTASDEPMSVLCIAQLHFKIENFSWNFDFLVVPSLHLDAILGIDFMRYSGLVLSIHSSSFAFTFCGRDGNQPRKQIKFSTPTAAKIEDQVLPMTVEEDSSPCEVDLTHLSSEMQTRVNRILAKFPQVLTPELGATHLLEHEIEMTDLSPVRSHPYSALPPKMAILREKVLDLERKRVIRPSKSNYASPAFLVPKGETDHRLVIDYRKLNQKIKIEAVPLPDINTAFSWFKGAKFFCVLDLNSAYNQIPLAKDSIPKTAFCVPWGLYEYLRVPFGLATGAQVLTRLTNILFSDLRYFGLVNFLDDIVLYASTEEELLKLLEEVLRRLAEAGITVNPKKLRVLVRKISYLGHWISARGIEIDQDRTKAIREFKAPKDKDGVARFIGMVNFYAKFIPRFAERAAILNALRRKKVPFRWTAEHQKAFEDLKECIISPPILQTPDFNKPFIVQTDGSSIALGAVLLQEFDGTRMPVAHISRPLTDTERLPISYASRTLTEQERKCSAYEIECLAVLFALDKFRVYLEHAEFLLECDNEALTWLLSHPRQLGKIARWVVRISAFKFQVKHIRGVCNVTADALSRMFDKEELEEKTPQVEGEARVNAIRHTWPQCPIGHMDLLTHQMQEPEIRETIEKLGKLKPGAKIKNYVLNKGVLCCVGRDKSSRVVLPEALVPMAFNFYHNSPFGGHLGAYKTLSKMRESFTYHRMSKDVYKRVKKCADCAFSKPAQQTNFGQMVSADPQQPMERFYIDFVGPLVRSKSGNKYILTCLDGFTKFTWLVPVRDATGEITVRELTKIFQSFGLPTFLVSDNGKHFKNNVVANFCFSFGITHEFTAPYHPQGNLAERINKNLRSALIAFHHNSQNCWDQSLPWLQLAFNSAKHESLSHTPFEMIFTFKPADPLTLMWKINDLISHKTQDVVKVWKEAKRQILKARKKNSVRYNQNRADNPYRVGDLVLVKTFPQSKKAKAFMAKLAHRWMGPLQIQRFVSPVSVALVSPDDGKFQKVANISHLKPFKC